MEARPGHETLEHIRRAGLERSISIDIESAGDDIEAVAGLRLDNGHAYSSRTARTRAPMLQELDRLSEGTEFVVGHNVTAHDLRELGRHDPELQLLRFAPVDTLILSPIAFPQRPYHHLVKPYKTPALARLQANDPLLDARTAAVLLDDICAAFTEKHESAPAHIEAWHWLLTRTPAPQGYDTLFRHIRGAATPSDKSARRAIVAALEGRGCPQEAERIAANATNVLLPTAWLIAWTSVAETGSIIPPYIWHRAPQVRDMVRTLRMRPCDDESCAWCSERHVAEKELKRWLGLQRPSANAVSRQS